MVAGATITKLVPRGGSTMAGLSSAWNKRSWRLLDQQYAIRSDSGMAFLRQSEEWST